MSVLPDTAAPRLRVFLSYSRVDSAFVDEIAAGLPLVGNFEVTLDRHSIETGVEWKERLEDLIEEADAVVFVLSPDFVKSDVCAWEVEVAARLGKRLVPVLLRPLGTAAPPAALGVINFVDATASGTMIATLKTLGNTLKTDLEWLKTSTRLLNLAQDWHEAGRPENRLLFAADIESAMAWLESTPAGVEVTDLQRDFVNASSVAYALRQDKEQQRLSEVAEANKRTALAAQRGRRWALGGLAFSVVLAVAAGIASLEALRQADLAKQGQREARLATEQAQRATSDARRSAQAARDAREDAVKQRETAELEARRAKFILDTMLVTAGLKDTGFDCSKTINLERPIEFLMCADDNLAKADVVLTEYYVSLRNSLKYQEARALQKEQIAWIKKREETCTPGKKLDESPDEIQVTIACALDIINRRNDELKLRLDAVQR